MISIRSVFFVMLAINACFLYVMLSVYPASQSSLAELQASTNQALFVQDKIVQKPQSKPQNKVQKEPATKPQVQVQKEPENKPQSKIEKISDSKPQAKVQKQVESKPQNSPQQSKSDSKPVEKSVEKKAPKQQKQEVNFTRETNPFAILGAYPEVKLKIPYTNLHETWRLDKVDYGLYNDDDYCERVDAYNLLHPENIFTKQNFFTDYAPDTIPRFLIPEIGDLVMKFSKYGNKITERQYHLNITINNFFVNMDGFHKHRKIGQHFLCATQMFNHIPGHRALVRKDDLVESVDRHAKKFESQAHCFNKQMFFPYNYRLYVQEECTAFFQKINSEEYKQSLKTEPIQYILKVGHGSHSAEGVYLLDQNQTVKVNNEYDFGKKCGAMNQSLIAQTYITNPLLLDYNNKFDFRVYMLIASTDPLIVYYHDGFLRASLSSYDKHSTEREKHLTNTHIAEGLFKDADGKKADGKKGFSGMNEEQLRDYHIWSFEKLEKYLLSSKKVSDPKWLQNHLRPQFKKAMIHIVKMSSEFFFKSPNVYGLFGLDFMLDENFNLWFIESNPNPQLIATSPFLGDLLEQILSSLFEIQYGLYRSRMSRVLDVIIKLKQQQQAGKVNLDELKQEYQNASRNRFEPKYRPSSKFNSFSLVMNEHLSSPKAYYKNIEPECAALL